MLLKYLISTKACHINSKVTDVTTVQFQLLACILTAHIPMMHWYNDNDNDNDNDNEISLFRHK